MIYVLLMLCLNPILWFIGKAGYLINGVDTNFPLDPLSWFLRRFYVWNSTPNAGMDFSSSTAGLFFHLIQVIPYYLGLSIRNVELVSLIFWFSAIVISSYLFSITLIKKSRLAQFAFVIFYTYNIYLFNSWENIKVANLSLMSATPLVLYVLSKVIESKSKLIKYFPTTVFASLLLSGAGINPAYFICFYTIFFLYFLSLFFSIAEKRKTIRTFLIMSLIIILVNLFWMLPTLNYILGTINTSSSLQSIGFTNWVDSLSENTSILNVLRMQGVWDWYAIDQVSGLPLFIPYALNFFHRFPFVLYSLLIPSFAILSLMFIKKKLLAKYVVFAVMLITGVFLGAGTHEPTGSVFSFLLNHLPFFSLFRSPWYIFTPMVVLGYAALIALLINQLTTDKKIPKVKKFGLWIFFLVFVVSNLLYSYPLVTGKIFRPGRSDGFYVSFPDYTFDAKKWLDSLDKDGRVIGYPDDEIEQFEWGYRGIESVLSLYTDRPVIFSPLNSSDSGVAKLAREFYSGLKKERISLVFSIAQRLNIDYIFAKSDQQSLSEGLPGQITDLEKNSFGKWLFYNLPSNLKTDKVVMSRNVAAVTPIDKGAEAIGLLSDNEIIVNRNDSVLGSFTTDSISLRDIVIAQPNELDNVEKTRYGSRDSSRSSFIFNVPAEGWYQPILPNFDLDSFFDLNQGSIETIVNEEKQILTIEKSDDSYVYFKPLYFQKGKNTITFNYGNRNVVFLQDFSSKDSGVLTLVNKTAEDVSEVFPVKDFNSKSKYLIEVKYLHSYGSNPGILTNQKRDKTNLKTVRDSLRTFHQWNVVSKVFDPVLTNSTLDISLVAPKTKDSIGTKVAFDDLKVSKLFTNSLILAQIDTQNLPVPSFKSYKRISQVEYEVDVNDADSGHIVVFKESYSPGWKAELYSDKGARISLSPVHFTGDMYANAWYVDDVPSSYKMRIYYAPQKIFNISFGISVISIILIAILPAILIKRKNV